MEIGTAVKCKRLPGVACRVVAWDAQYDDDTGEMDIDTSFVYVRMVGDDHRWRVPVEELEPLDEEDFCGECGQLGCMHGRPAS